MNSGTKALALEIKTMTPSARYIVLFENGYFPAGPGQA